MAHDVLNKMFYRQGERVKNKLFSPRNLVMFIIFYVIIINDQNKNWNLCAMDTPAPLQWCNNNVIMCILVISVTLSALLLDFFFEAQNSRKRKHHGLHILSFIVSLVHSLHVVSPDY